MIKRKKILFTVLVCFIFCPFQLKLDAAVGSVQCLKETPITASRADELYARLPKTDPWERMPDASTLAWSESSVLRALADLYEATNDPKYLEELAKRGDRLLTHRDDRRGVTDGSGKSRAAWSMAFKYVVAEGQFVDVSGKPVIYIRSTPSSNNQLTNVELISLPAKNEGRFTIKVSNSFYKRDELFANLSLDPADERYVEKIINDPMSPYSAKGGSYTEKSNLIRIRIAGHTVPTAQTVTLKPIPLAYMGYIGIIYDPMLRFAELVKANSSLQYLLPAAKRFIESAEESYADASGRLWRNGPNKDEGYYLTCEKGESFPADNVGAPFNFLARHVCAELALYRLTGKKAYLNRSEKMARLLKNRLDYHKESDLYIWKYWYEPMTTKGWSPKDDLSFNVKYFKAAAHVEDVSHGALDIGMIAACNQAGIVFNQEDMDRFANTLLINVLSPDRKAVRRGVNGGIEYPAYFNALQGWLELSMANPEVYHAIRQAYLYKGEESLAFCANLLKWERKLK
jgi:hypothetical protein